MMTIGALSVGGCLLAELRSSLLETRRETTRELVETAHNLIAGYGELAKSGALSLEEAQEAAIAGVSRAANDTGAAAGDIRSAAGELSQQSERLRDEVGRFLDGVRTA